MDSKHPIVCVVGPTAVGKTDLSLFLAEQLDGEIVSADSMQVYQHLDIGTAKIPERERRGIPHHLIDVVPPTAAFTVHEYAVLARKAVADIHARGRLPIVVGGTGLYIRALVDALNFTLTARDDILRSALEEEARSGEPAVLHERLCALDPDAAKKIHANDTRRVIRALEIVLSSGQPVARNYASELPSYHAVRIGLTAPRDILYQRIEQRIDHMMEQGLLQEVRQLVEYGCTEQHTAMQAIGYKELLDVLQGRLMLEEAVLSIKQASRRYAKRQLSWFRADRKIKWYGREEDGMMDKMFWEMVQEDVIQSLKSEQ